MNTIITALQTNLSKVIIGKQDTIDLLLTALLSGGHVLLEDLPGCGKTTLAKALAKSINAECKRIQFTPDLLPADITGVSIYHPDSQTFEFQNGPVFTNILLADEINRATPRTQSALLESMEEHQVTVDGITYSLPLPHFVIATQNPIEAAGTFPLPEAQMDRFTMRLSIGYPDLEQEITLMSDRFDKNPLDELTAVASTDDILALIEECKHTYIHPCLISYIAQISQKSRNFEGIAAGISPRGSITLMQCSKTYAFLQGRDYVTPQDIQTLVIPVLNHRLLSAHDISFSNNTTAQLQQLMNTITVPTENWRKK